VLSVVAAVMKFLENARVKLKRIISMMLMFLVVHFTATFNYREADNDGDNNDDLNDDEWYETFSVKAEEKIYDDLCSVTATKVDEWLRTGTD